MKSKILYTVFYCLFVLITSCSGQNERASTSYRDQDFPLRIIEPVETIIADLKNFIPDYIDDEYIPGVGIALIVNGKVVWTDGFGVKNTITKDPVTTNTLFEVASLSKVVTAYMALKLVDEEKISFDMPLHSYLKEDWLPASVYRDSIKIFHVASHSSGLGKMSKDIMFKPGSAYYYSANGFVFLKEVMEVVTGESFEELAQRLVFKPLGMKNSSFTKEKKFIPQTANGHIRALVPTVLFGILFSILFTLIFLFGLCIIRFLKNSWYIKRSHTMTFLSITLIFLISPLFVLFGINSIMEFAWFIAICGFVILTVFLLLFYFGQRIILRQYPAKKVGQRVLRFLWGVIIIIGIVLFAGQIRNLPVPRSPDYHVSPAGSLRTSAEDLALFLLEIANPQFLSSETSAYLRTPQIKLSENLSWGMGPGILHSEQGYALWQWGQHIDFQSIMIIYPQHEFGIVICTNNDLLNPDVAVEIAHRALGGKIEPLRRAIHLNFDYRE